MADLPLRVIPLGGVGEIGKNLMVLEYDQDILVIDAGLMFPENDMLGIDLVYPDITYLTARADRVQGIVLTHGHEDHIGALSYLLKYLDVPVYATPLTRGLAEVRLKEAGLLADAELHTITPDDVLELGCFKVEFFHVCHSIPDAVGVAVTTPLGLVVHASDYKFDQHPVDGKLTDVAKLRALGDRGVLLLLSDSTNADTDGFTPSEQRVTEALERIMADTPGRLIVATFASNISRIQQVIQVARGYGRQVGVVGRSMVNNVRMSINLGYLDVSPDDLLTTSEMNGLPRDEVVIVCTGSQGEPTAVLARLAGEEHPQLQIIPGDTVVLSATPIPGNEELVNKIIDDSVPAGRQCDLLRPVRRACVGARQPRRSQDDALAGAAALLRADARRIPPSDPALTHRTVGRHPAREHGDHRERPGGRGDAAQHPRGRARQRGACAGGWLERGRHRLSGASR